MQIKQFFSDHHRLGSFIVGSLIGGLVFVKVFGLLVLNPTNVGWLLNGNDLAQHYLGWAFYQQSPVSFPLGSIGNLAYPLPMSIVFLDSIPLLAIPLKLLTSWVQTPIQYFGIWGLVSFGLQGGISALIVSRWTKNQLVAGLGGLIVVMSPIMLARMFVHTALGGQWILLLGLLVALEARRWKLTVAVGVWTMVLVLSSMIHPYFTLMIGVLYLTWLILQPISWVKKLLSLIMAMSIVAISFWVIGGFMVKNVEGTGLGTFSYTLISFMDSAGWSRFLQPMGTKPEGMGYAGLGVIMLTVVSSMILAFQSKETAKLLNWRNILAVIPLIGLMIFALGPVIKMGSQDLWAYSVPGMVEGVWSIFRATGRMAWIHYYLVTFSAIWVICRRLRYTMVILVLFISAGLLQTIDISGSAQWLNRSSQIKERSMIKDLPIVSEEWDQISKNRQHIIYLGKLVDPQYFTEVSSVALKYHLTLNTGYFARTPSAMIQTGIDSAIASLEEGDAQIDTIYMTRDQGLIDSLTGVRGLKITKVDSYWVITKIAPV